MSITLSIYGGVQKVELEPMWLKVKTDFIFIHIVRYTDQMKSVCIYITTKLDIWHFQINSKDYEYIKKIGFVKLSS